MSKHKNPLEKEFLIRQYKNNPGLKMSEFCDRNDMSVTAFMKWIKQYDEGGIEALARADAEFKDVQQYHPPKIQYNYKCLYIEF